jgi:hypothetical protein
MFYHLGFHAPFMTLIRSDQKSLNKGWQEKLDDLAAIVTGCAMIVVIGLIPALCFLTFMSFFVLFHTATIVAYAKWPLIIAAIVGSGLFIAWRWIVGTALLFALLVVDNELYIHWLATSKLIARLGGGLS